MNLTGCWGVQGHCKGVSWWLWGVLGGYWGASWWLLGSTQCLQGVFSCLLLCTMLLLWVFQGAAVGVLGICWGVLEKPEAIVIEVIFEVINILT